MLGYIRIFVVMFFLLTIVYVALRIIGRVKQRDKLNAEYARLDPKESKDEFVGRGLVKYGRSHRAKLVLTIYLLPLAVASLLLFLAHT